MADSYSNAPKSPSVLDDPMRSVSRAAAALADRSVLIIPPGSRMQVAGAIPPPTPSTFATLAPDPSVVDAEIVAAAGGSKAFAQAVRDRLSTIRVVRR